MTMANAAFHLNTTEAYTT